jgi:hypothetical protein
MQMLTDIAIDPAGDVWVASNWQEGDKCFGKPQEARSTYCGGNGLTVFWRRRYIAVSQSIGAPAAGLHHRQRRVRGVDLPFPLGGGLLVRHWGRIGHRRPPPARAASGPRCRAVGPRPAVRRKPTGVTAGG